MVQYVVWELRHLDPHGEKTLLESRGLSVKAENIKACADKVRHRKAFIKHGVKQFLIVERGHRILPSGGPLNFFRGDLDLEDIASDKEKEAPFRERDEKYQL